ncbi:MAG TPA: hypothetical protein VGA99_09495 [bacterium]
MPIIHTNRKADKYYLHQSTTKKGNPRYYFSRSAAGNLVETIPQGYEVYENPNTQVFLRKKMPQLISEAEIAIIEDNLKRNESVKDCKIDVRETTLTIHVPDQEVSDVKAFGLDPQMNAVLKKFLAETGTYSPMMRFKLIDETERIFAVERYVFRGEGWWLPLGSGKDLQNLSKKYCQHLGKESFFELIF